MKVHIRSIFLQFIALALLARFDSALAEVEPILYPAVKGGAINLQTSVAPSREEQQSILDAIKQARMNDKSGEWGMALKQYAYVWEHGQSLKDPKWVLRINRAAADYLDLLRNVGRSDTIRAIVDVYKAGRSTTGMGESYGEAQRALVYMENEPGRGFKCGVYALAMVGNALALIDDAKSVTPDSPSSKEEFSLADLQRIGRSWGITEMKLVQRTSASGSTVYPVVAHLRTGQFVALMGEENGKIRMADGTQKVGSREALLDRETVAAMLDGYFAVIGPTPEGYRVLSEEEARSVRHVDRRTECWCKIKMASR